MLTALYRPGDSWLHHWPAGRKLGALAAAGLGLFALSTWPAQLVAALVGLALAWRVCGSLRLLARLLWPLAWAIAAVGVFAFVFEGGTHAAMVVLRLLALVSLGLAVTVSTPAGAMIEAIETGLQPLARRGWVDAGQVALVFALTLRFVPQVWHHYGQIREAQAARGLSASLPALVIPLLVRVLQDAEEIAQAIDARR